jgi:superkiller protein 3
LAGRINIILDEVDRLERGQRWPEARAAAERIDAALADSEADDATRQRFREARRDLDFVGRLERIRLVRYAIINGMPNLGHSVREYASTFRDYGVDVEALPTEEAVARLQARPALALPVAASLDDWTTIRATVSEKDAAGWKRLVAVARGLDHDPLRDRLRATWGTEVTRAELLRLSESIDLTTESPTSAQLLAENLVRAGYPDAATRVLRDAQYAHPDDVWLNWLLSDHLDRVGDRAGAVRYSSIAVSLRPESALAHNNLGSALLQQGKLDEAFAECRKAIELDSKCVPALINLGDVLSGKRRLDEAIASYRKAIDIDPKCVAALVNLGAALAGKRRLDEALAECRKAIKLDPKCALAHNNLGSFLFEQGKRDEGLAECRKAIELDPRSESIHANLGGVLCDLGMLDEAIVECRKAIALNPNSAQAQNNLGTALSAQGKLDEAIACHRKAIELDPNFASAHAKLGIVQYRQGKLDEAIASFRKAIELDPNPAANHYNLGWALHKQGKLDEAVACFTKAVELDPRFAEQLNTVAWNLATNPEPKRRDGRQAVAVAQLAVKAAPSNGINWRILGAAHFCEGHWKQAALDLQKSIELLVGGDSFDWFLLAMAHWQLGDQELARKWYAAAVLWMDKYASGDAQLRSMRDEAAALLGVTAKDPQQAPAGGDVEIWTLVLEAQPDSAEARCQRADAYATRAEWAKAAADYASAFDAGGSTNPFQWFQYAVLQLQLGDVEGYRKLCDRMRERFGSSRTMEDIALLAHTGVLAPGAFGDLSVVRQLAEQRLALTPLPSVHHVWSVHVLGVAYYRTGQHAESVSCLEKGLKDQADWDYNVLNWLVLAMAEQRLGHANIAKEYLLKADNWINQKAQAAPKASGRFAPPDWLWRDWLLVQLLRREAGALIEGQDKKE